MVEVGGAKEDLSPSTDVCTAACVLLSHETVLYLAIVLPSQAQQG